MVPIVTKQLICTVKFSKDVPKKHLYK